METDSCEEEMSSKEHSEDEHTETKSSKRSDSFPLLKLLVPNSTAGALIGKGGANISAMQTKFGGSVHLSPNRQYYPGTSERIVVITGDFNQIVDVHNHIMEKLQEDQYDNADKKIDEGRSQLVKIVLTNGAAGLLIGRGGLTIKGIQEETNAKITISNREDSVVPGERVLTMSGSMEQRIEACQQVIQIIADEASNVRNSNLKYMNDSTHMSMSYGGNHGYLSNNSQQVSNNVFPALYNNPRQVEPNHMSMLSNFGMRGLSDQSGCTSKFKGNMQIQVEVPDTLVGAILGRSGQAILEVTQFSGANIKFSEKNEFVQGTTNRILTISGDMKQAETAYFLISQRVEQVKHELNNRY